MEGGEYIMATETTTRQTVQPVPALVAEVKKGLDSGLNKSQIIRNLIETGAKDGDIMRAFVANGQKMLHQFPNGVRRQLRLKTEKAASKTAA
jgi:hypothetical protein